jgi:high-affinity iron transporter
MQRSIAVFMAIFNAVELRRSRQAAAVRGMRIPPRALFATATVLITLLAAGMAAQAVAFLQRANWLTPLDTVMWDSGWLLSESSIVGRALHTLVGYTDQPTVMQIVIYLAVILVTVMLMRLVGSERRQHAIAAG